MEDIALHFDIFQTANTHSERCFLHILAVAVAWISSEGEIGAAESHCNMMEVMRQEKSSGTPLQSTQFQHQRPSDATTPRPREKKALA